MKQTDRVSKARAASQITFARRRVLRHLDDLERMPAETFRDPATVRALTSTYQRVMSTLGGTVSVTFDGGSQQ